VLTFIYRHLNSYSLHFTIGHTLMPAYIKVDPPKTPLVQRIDLAASAFDRALLAVQ